MKAIELETDNPDVRLVEPVIERDARLGVEWLHGDIGRNTLQLMGVSDEHNKPSTLELEKERVAGFIERPDQLNWMIEYDSHIVGTIWVDLEPIHNVPAPAIHIMIGDSSVRGKGVGTSATTKVAEYLKEQGNKSIYSRHLTKNNIAKSLLESQGFKTYGEPYSDKDGLEWQNAKKQLD